MVYRILVFYIVLFNHNHLNSLFDNKEITEIRVIEATCTHTIDESSALSPFQFNNKTVNETDNHMLNNRRICYCITILQETM